MKPLLKLLIFVALFGVIGCTKPNNPHDSAADSTNLAKAFNRYYRFEGMSDSALANFAKNSPEPIHNFTKRQQFLDYQKHQYDSLRWLMK